MKSLVRRLFPKYPVIGLTLIVLLLLEASAGAITLTIIGWGHATEGSWSSRLVALPEAAPYCDYLHYQDPHEITGDFFVDPLVGVAYNAHHHTCIGYVNAQGGCDPKPTSCSGSLNQDHYEEL